jgi:hypothetical protein
LKSTILDGGRDIDDSEGIDVPLIDFPAFLRDKLATRPEIAFIKLDIEGAEPETLETPDRETMFDRIRVLVAETQARKFKDLRPRFRALRQGFAERHDPNRVNLDWI